MWVIFFHMQPKNYLLIAQILVKSSFLSMILQSFTLFASRKTFFSPASQKKVNELVFFWKLIRLIINHFNRVFLQEERQI